VQSNMLKKLMKNQGGGGGKSLTANTLEASSHKGGLGEKRLDEFRVRRPPERKEKVYLDFLRRDHGIWVHQGASKGSGCSRFVRHVGRMGDKSKGWRGQKT